MAMKPTAGKYVTWKQLQEQRISDWFCHYHPQEFLVNGDCPVCDPMIYDLPKIEAGRKYKRENLLKKSLYNKAKRGAKVKDFASD